MTPCAKRRAILLRPIESDSVAIERVLQTHRLEIVYTVVTDTGPKLAALIAIQHLLDHDAEVIVLPHIGIDELRQGRPWQAVALLADLVTADGVIESTLFDTLRTGYRNRSIGGSL